MFLLHHLETLGIAGSTLRKKLQLDERWLERTEDSELAALVPELISAAVQLSGDELLCLHAGEKFHFCLGGLAGLAATHAPTPALALGTFGRFIGCEGVLKVVVRESPGETSIEVQVEAEWPAAIEAQIVDGFASCLIAALRSLVGPSLSTRRVLLMRPQSESTPGEFGRILKGPVVFEAERNLVAFSSRDLAQSSLLFDAQLYEQLQFITDLRTEETASTSPLRQLVEQTIHGGAHTIEMVADTLQISTRTLQRRLKTERTTFRTVLGEVRVDMARTLLTETDMSIADIADKLHYSDDRALRKAIKKILAQTPSEIRQRAETPK